MDSAGQLWSQPGIVGPTRARRLPAITRTPTTNTAPNTNPNIDRNRCQTDAVNRAVVPIGAIGAVLVAASSWWVGAVPFGYQTHPPPELSWFAIGSIGPRVAFYAGLTLMAAAWLAIGRAVLGPSETCEVHRLQRAVLAWAAPVTAAMPLASRDLWAYAAQGHLIQHGLDPYRSAPSDLPGVLADNVSPGWIHSTAPYGPLWLAVNRGLATWYGPHVVVAVFLLRVPVLLGLALLVWAVPRIASATNIRPDRALWLAVLNPFTVELVLGAGHNDLIMAGLMAYGAALVLGPGSMWTTLVPGAAVMALAAAVKSPALVAVAFTVPMWLSRPGIDRPGASRPGQVGRRHHLGDPAAPTAVAFGTAAITFVVVTAVTGLGFGWATQVGSSARTVNWLSLPTDAAIVADVITGHVRGSSRLDRPMEHWRTAGLVLAAAAVVALWLRAVLTAKSAPTGPVALLGVALLALIVLGPAVQLWYLCWALPFLTAATSHHRMTIALVATQLAMIYTVDPHGLSFTMKPAVLPILAASAVTGWCSLRGIEIGYPTGSVPGDDDADGARPGVHTDGGRHL